MYFHFIPRKGAKMIMTMLDVKDKNPRHHINSPSSQRQYVMASALVVQVSQRHKVFFWGERVLWNYKGCYKLPQSKSNKKSSAESWKKKSRSFWAADQRLIKSLRRHWHHASSGTTWGHMSSIKRWMLGPWNWSISGAISACRSPVLHPNAVETQKKQALNHWGKHPWYGKDSKVVLIKSKCSLASEVFSENSSTMWDRKKSSKEVCLESELR